MKKLWLIIILALLLVGCEFSFPQNTNPSFTGTNLSIVAFNDTHGYIMQNEYGQYGISNVAHLVDEIRAEKGEDNVLLIANGDMFQGTGLVRMSYGEVMIDVMNEMGFDACCLGNHEFDWDLPVILNYFDGEKENGEANFPLLNANVYQDDVLIADDNVFESIIVEKDGVNVGIIGYIGDVSSSINAIYADKYEFDTKIADSVKVIGANLKKAGADIIVVSVHDASTQGVDKYSVNRELAMLKYDGEYLVDAVINGHTHTEQKGQINRAGGVAMPVIQSSPYRSGSFYGFGEIELEIDKNKNVSGFFLSHRKASEAKGEYNEQVEAIVDQYYAQSEETLTAKYCYNEAYASRYDNSLQKWVTNVMLAATGADIAICNTGGLRTNLNQGYLTFEDLYQFNPFDNKVIIHECSYDLVNPFASNEDYYIYSTPTGKLKTSGTYKVAVIDYVYYSSYYRKLRSDNFVDTELVLRDLLIEDLSLRNEINFGKNNQAIIELKVK